ncbi:hypothetical protein AJ78_02479 [Emergomyces pasteurianus Ep9510]|uniref:GRF-type domain-containing protein n=1 Tax=Emergomyces pasteurianus Ep9510 TaxID=1447872 RepID=A0A1J9QML8_9EURO|nr:hypothetical protein AJ78_02479 [Emergomyces pasteurianus Ep9510]
MFARHNPTPTTPPARDRNNQSSSASRGFSTPSRSTAIPLRGLLVNGVWHCNCEPRRQADRFQTKNGGKNHGRWFYTCTKPQTKRCNFFLWEDEAEIRESDMMKVLEGTGAAVGTISNANMNAGGISSIGGGFMNRTSSRPLTQASIDARTGLLTPQTGSKRHRDGERGHSYGLSSVNAMGSPSKKSRVEDVLVKGKDEDEADDDSFGWDDDLEGIVVEQLVNQDDLQKEQSGQHNFRPSTPRRSPGWFRDGQGLFMSDDEDEGSHGDGGVGRPSGTQDIDVAGLDDPFGPVAPSSRLFAPYQSANNDSASTSLSRFSTPQTTHSMFTYGQNTATTPSRTTIADPSDLAAPSTPTPIRFNSTPLLHGGNEQELPATSHPIISSTTTSIIGIQKTGTIVSKTLALLSRHNILMTPAAKRELVSLLNVEYLRTQGIIKARDISRAAVQSRDAQIQRLRGRIEVLEAEREGFRLGRMSRDLSRFDTMEGVEERDEG